MTNKTVAVVCVALVSGQQVDAWGFRGHTVANLAAVELIDGDGPNFLKMYKAYIGHLGPIPDSWRSVSEPYLRISEDPNHGWYTESFDFIKEIPRSRTEFTLRVYDEYLRVSKTDPERAKLLNIRYTGLEAYSMMEGYERMKAGMRLYRLASGQASGLTSGYQSIGACMDRYRHSWAILSRLVSTLRVMWHSIWDGWDTTSPTRRSLCTIPNIMMAGKVTIRKAIRGTPIFIAVSNRPTWILLRLLKQISCLTQVNKLVALDDPWMAILEHMIEARASAEDVYRLDLRGAFKEREDAEARKLVYTRLASGASFLRDLAYTAWIESAKPDPPVKETDIPNNPQNPRYNPATGSAPAPARRP
jgi:hypothetical protein